MASQYQYDRRDELDRRLSNLSEARASLDGVSSQMSRASYNVLAAHLNNGTTCSARTRSAKPSSTSH